MAWTRSWDESTPTDNTFANEIDDYMRNSRTDTAERLKDFIYGFTTGEDAYSAHAKKILFREQASVTQPAANYGAIYLKEVSGVAELFWQDESGNEKQLTSAGKINVAATEACLLTGNQTVGGVKTFTDGIAVGADTDMGNFEIRAKTFESDVPTGTAPFTIASTTVSTNLNADMVDGKHADALLGTWANKSLNTAYEAQSDGFVCASITATDVVHVIGFTDAANPPTTEVIHNSNLYAYSSPNPVIAAITMPVRKGDYWKVTATGSSGSPVASIKWIPLGA